MAVQKSFDDILARIANLLARADHPNTPVAEAQLARERAERLMRQHRVDEASLSAEDKAAQGIKPVSAKWTVGDGGEFMNYYLRLAGSILQHVGAFYHTEVQWNSQSGHSEYVLDAYGFESDLVYAQMIFQAARLGFGEALEPRIDGMLSDEDNVYRMRSAGMERNRIANALWGSDFKDGAAHNKVQRLYKTACAKRDEQGAVGGKGFNIKVYRTSFAESFVYTMQSRLYTASIAAGQDSHSLVLQSRVEEVKEAFWTAYPQYRPTPRPVLPNAGQMGRAQCSKCAAAKSGYCRDHAYLKPRKGNGFKWNEDAIAAGRGAARRVDLETSGTRLNS